MTVRRLKTYTGSQGYVYQYYFVGKRAAPSSLIHKSAIEKSAIDKAANPKPDTTEYVFDVTSDRKLTYAVSIFLPHQVVAAWAESHGRVLSDSEQYAAVKMRLFRAFDELEDMRAQGRQLQVDAPSIEESLASLGVE